MDSKSPADDKRGLRKDIGGDSNSPSTSPQAETPPFPASAIHARRLMKRSPSWAGHSQTSPGHKRLGSQLSVALTNPHSPVDSGVTVGGSATKLMTLSDLGKKHLVSQFYDTSINNSTDNSIDTGAKTPILTSPSASKLLDGFDFQHHERGKVMSDADFHRLMENGGLQFLPSSDRLENDDDLTDWLLTIDNLINIWHNQDENDTLEPLQEFIDSITTAYAANAERPFQHQDNPVESLQQLDQLQVYLFGLSQSTKSLLTTLATQKDTTKARYRQAIRENVDTLTKLQDHLQHTESRLEQLRQRANAQKRLIGEELSSKIHLVEEISAKVASINETTRANRFHHFRLFLAFIFTVVAAYWYWR